MIVHGAGVTATSFTCTFKGHRGGMRLFPSQGFMGEGNKVAGGVCRAGGCVCEGEGVGPGQWENGWVEAGPCDLGLGQVCQGVKW